jgi:hypothetical protein
MKKKSNFFLIKFDDYDEFRRWKYLSRVRKSQPKMINMTENMIKAFCKMYPRLKKYHPTRCMFSYSRAFFGFHYSKRIENLIYSRLKYYLSSPKLKENV